MALFPDITSDDIFRLETPSLWLRWLRAGDAASVTAIASLAKVARMTASIPHPYPPGEAERFILHARATTAAGDALILAVTQKGKSQPLVGIVSAQACEREHEVEIGYVIAPTAAGQGYAGEATATLVDAVFNLTETRVIVAASRVDNPASRRVLEKCGFLCTGTGSKPMPARGGEQLCDVFVLDRHLWSSRTRISRLPAMAQQRPRHAPRAIGESAQ